MSLDVVFAGLGKMGAPMARHLRAGGHRVLGVEPSAPRRAALLADGWAADALCPDLDAALAALARRQGAGEAPGVVVSSLPDDAALRACAAALADAVRAHRGAVATWVDTSTVSPEASHAAAAAAEAVGVACVRAPVSGNATMAERAALAVFASGPPAACRAVEPLFACWGTQWRWLGPGDEARVAKLVVNLLVAGTSTMLAEAFALGVRGGLDWQTLWQVVEASAVASPLVKAKAPALRAHDYTPTFTVEQMRKDLALIRGAAAALGVAVPVAEIADGLLARAVASDAAAEDYAVVIRSAVRAADPG